MSTHSAFLETHIALQWNCWKKKSNSTSYLDSSTHSNAWLLVWQQIIELHPLMWYQYTYFCTVIKTLFRVPLCLVWTPFAPSLAFVCPAFVVVWHSCSYFCVSVCVCWEKQNMYCFPGWLFSQTLRDPSSYMSQNRFSDYFWNFRFFFLDLSAQEPVSVFCK